MVKNIDIAYFVKYCLLLLSYGMGGTQFTNIPILFYRPTKIILDPDNPSDYSFSQEYPQIWSLPMELDLFGDRELYEIMIVTSGYVGKFVAFILLFAFPIQEQYQHYAVYGAVLSQGVFTVLMDFFPYPAFLSLAFFMWFGSFSYLLGQIFSYTYKNFTGKLSENSVISLNLTWPVIMLVHIFYSYCDGNWRANVVYFTGYSNLFLGICLLLVHNLIRKLDDQNEEKSSFLQDQLLENFQETSNLPSEMKLQEQESNTSVMQNQNANSNNNNNNNTQEAGLIFTEASKNLDTSAAKKQFKNKLLNFSSTDNISQPGGTQQNDIINPKDDANKSSFEIFKDNIKMFKKDVTQRTNIMIWTLVWNAVGCSFVGCVIVLNRLKGNLYVNLMMSTVFELFGNIAAVYILKTFPLKQTIIVCLYIMGIAYLVCFSLDSWTRDNSEGSMLKIIVSLIPVLVAKGTHEAMWNIVIEFQRQVIRLKYHQFSFAVANLFDMSITSTLPTYQYIMEQNGINQFIGYGLYALIAARASSKFKLFNKTSYFLRKSSISKCSGLSKAKPSDIFIRPTKIECQQDDQVLYLDEVQHETKKNVSQDNLPVELQSVSHQTSKENRQ